MSCSRRVGCWSCKGCCGCWWFREDWSLRIFTLKVWAEWLNVPIIQLKWINMCSKGQTGMQWFVVCLWSENRETVGRDLWWSQEVPHGAWNLDLWEHARLPAEGSQGVVLLLSCVCFLLFDVFQVWDFETLKYCTVGVFFCVSACAIQVRETLMQKHQSFPKRLPLQICFTICSWRSSWTSWVPSAGGGALQQMILTWHTWRRTTKIGRLL